MKGFKKRCQLPVLTRYWIIWAFGIGKISNRYSVIDQSVPNVLPIY